MSEETIPCQETQRDEWVRWKKRKIGGHAAAAIMGVHPKVTITEVYDLIAHGIDSRAMSEETRAFLDWRASMEPLIVGRYAAKTGRMIRRTKSKVHPQLKECIASPDREILKDDRGVGLLEAKSVFSLMWKKMQMAGLDPFFWVQNQHYLWVRGDSWGDIAAADVSSGELLTFEHEADKEFHAELEKRICDFLALVDAGIRPETAVDPVRLPEISGDLVRVETMEQQAVTLFGQLTENEIACTQMKNDAEAIRCEARLRLQVFMEKTGMDVAQLGSVRVYNREQAGRKTLDKKALVSAHPEIDLDKYTKVGNPFRTLRVYPDVKEKEQ